MVTAKVNALANICALPYDLRAKKIDWGTDMKTKFFAAAAATVCALAAAPAAFAGDGDGYVDASYQRLTGGGGVDAYGANLNLTYADANGAPSQYTAAQVTLYKRGKTGMVGAYGAYADSFGSNSGEGGLVGQMYGDKHTLSGVAGYGGNAGDNYWVAGASLTYYVRPDIAFSVTGGYNSFNHNIGHTSVVNVQAEWKPMIPVSFFVGYTNESFSAGGDADVVSVGARWNFGNKTLKDRDQSGVITPISQRLSF
jgi:hypothetical protein